MAAGAPVTVTSEPEVIDPGEGPLLVQKIQELTGERPFPYTFPEELHVPTLRDILAMELWRAHHLEAMSRRQRLASAGSHLFLGGG